ncbi:MAG: hypothetical protein M1351_02225 [Candidatus Thermoplasmatota archaeon]|nr:hypothetical protein [Candidatus Thermoplasmatota archaeon]
MKQIVQKVLEGRRITLPDESTKRFDIHVGDYVLVEAAEDMIIVRPAEVVPKIKKK